MSLSVNTNQGLEGKTPSYWVTEHQSQEICPVQILIKSLLDPFKILFRSYLNPIQIQFKSVLNPLQFVFKSYLKLSKQSLFYIIGQIPFSMSLWSNLPLVKGFLAQTHIGCICLTFPHCAFSNPHQNLSEIKGFLAFVCFFSTVYFQILPATGQGVPCGRRTQETG